MKPSEVLKRLKELKEVWHQQGFSLNKEQQAEYDRLLQVRRERVQYFIKNGIVSKGGLKTSTDKTPVGDK